MMKLNKFACVGLAISLLSVSVAQAEVSKDVPGKSKAAKSGAAQLVKLDPATSTVAWFATKATGKHQGTVKMASGEVTVANGVVKTGTVVIDMTSLENEDVKDAEYHKKLVTHLKSDDFFGVEKFPTAQFKITGVKPIANAAEGKPNFDVTGDLTIKGKTFPQTFPALITLKDGKAIAKGTMTVDRTLYDIRYGSGKFFENLGDHLIHDKFNVEMNLVGTM